MWYIPELEQNNKMDGAVPFWVLVIDCQPVLII